MNEALEPSRRRLLHHFKLALMLLASVAAGLCLALLVHPRHPRAPGAKPRPAETPTRQEPTKRPNTSLDPELICELGGNSAAFSQLG